MTDAIRTAAKLARQLDTYLHYAGAVSPGERAAMVAQCLALVAVLAAPPEDAEVRS